MGSLRDKIHDMLEEQRELELQKKLEEIGDEVKNMCVDSLEYDEFMYVWNNRKKIFKNRGLINLLG